MPGKRARPVWREVARKRPEFTKIELGTSPGGPPYPGLRPANLETANDGPQGEGAQASEC